MKEPTDTNVFNLTRRSFLTWQAALLATVARPDCWRLADGHAVTFPLLSHFFRRELPIAVHIGRKYLESAPSERSERRLMDVILGTAWDDGTGDIQALTTRVRTRRELDFREGDLVAIDGWFLARTEARLFALAALTANS